MFQTDPEPLPPQRHKLVCGLHWDHSGTRELECRTGMGSSEPVNVKPGEPVCARMSDGSGCRAPAVRQSRAVNIALKLWGKEILEHFYQPGKK